MGTPPETPRAVALYRFSLSTINRADGRSAIAAAAYRAGERLHDARQDRVHDYRRKARGVHASALIGADDRAELWNRVEAEATRKNSRLAYEVQLALPHELAPADGWRLAEGFARWLHARYAQPVDVAMHRPHRGDQRHREGGHAHLLLPGRVVGLARDGRREVHALREAWAEHCNRALAEAGRGERVDHRSRARQGAAAEPVHVPRAAVALEQRGERTEAGEVGRQRRQRNQARRIRGATGAPVPVPPPARPTRRRRVERAAPGAAQHRRLLAALAAQDGPAVAPSGPQEPRTGARQPAPTPPAEARAVGARSPRRGRP